jgi:hypothetical protein
MMDWDEEREGYIKPPSPAYPAIHVPPNLQSGRHHLLSLRGEEILSGLITIAGGAWAVYVVAVQQGSVWHLQLLPPGPAEVCGLGLLIWLHAKWRHASAK